MRIGLIMQPENAINERIQMTAEAGDDSGVGSMSKEERS
jgi:hypothetical protein